MGFTLRVLGIFLFLTVGYGVAGQETAGTVRTYYIAADEIDWNYMPGGSDGMMGMAPHGYAKMYATHTAKTIGPIYRKALYREYTDATFKHLKPRTKDQAYLGALGPIIRAEVGDTIDVVFRNNGTHPYSMHSHGVLYDKGSEGSAYADGVDDARKAADAVPPGKTATYVWKVPERAGPGPNDPSSIVWFYHSHADERSDVNSGLIGPIVITRAGMATPDGRPKDVDKEFVTLFMIYDENRSLFIGDNVKRFLKPGKKFDPTQSSPFDPTGRFDPLGGSGFVPSNFRSTINGYQFADGPLMTMKVGDRVRWYVLSLGEGLNFHTPHWHGNTLLWNGQRTDVFNLGPASMMTADMTPDDPGTWLLHCHVSEHMEQGMVAKYKVER